MGACKIYQRSYEQETKIGILWCVLLRRHTPGITHTRIEVVKKRPKMFKPNGRKIIGWID